MHIRSEIRQTIKDELLNKTDAGANIFTDRLYPVQTDSDDSELPAIAVYIPSDNRVQTDYSEDTVDTKILITVGSIGEDAQDVVDTITNQVEALINNSTAINELFQKFSYGEGIADIDDGNHGNLRTWTITYNAQYISSTINDSTLALLKTANIDYNNSMDDTVSLGE